MYLNPVAYDKSWELNECKQWEFYCFVTISRWLRSIQKWDKIYLSIFFYLRSNVEQTCICNVKCFGIYNGRIFIYGCEVQTFTNTMPNIFVTLGTRVFWYSILHYLQCWWFLLLPTEKSNSIYLFSVIFIQDGKFHFDIAKCAKERKKKK